MTHRTPAAQNASCSPWLPGCEPGQGRLARAYIRSTDDIRAVEAIAPESVLPGGTIYECIRYSAGQNAEKPAFLHLRSADTSVEPRSISYAELLDQIERSANLFRRLAGDERSSVSIILPMLPEALIAAWGAATAGIANPINPYLEVRQIASIMNAAETTVLVTTVSRYGPGAWDKLGELTSMVPSLKKVLFVEPSDSVDDFAAAVAACPAGLEFEPNTDPHAEAVYLPTGGTTAAPKLVRQTHFGQLLNAWITGAMAGSRPEGVVGHAMPNFHVGGAVMLSLRAILYGQTVLTLTTDGFRNTQIVSNFWDVARHYRMTSLIATPATAAAILATPNASSEGHCIRSFNSGGSTIPVELLRTFHERFGVWLREVWGMSEIHGAVSGHPDDGREPVAGSVGVHLPWHPVKAIEVDEDNRFIRECAPGERGVLAIGGPGVVPGYVDSRLDGDFFVKDAPDGLRWANTGDLGMVDENGRIWMFGRAKDVIVRGGHNLDPKMIEEVLVCHPSVQIAAAIGRPDPAKGEMPIAYVQLKEGQHAGADELLELCRKNVQERAAIPVEIHLVDRIPMTAVGKINKPALRVDTMRRVATEVAMRVICDNASCEVATDETGPRPRVILRLSGCRVETQALEARLKDAFRTYEFLTVYEFQPDDASVAS